jgi:site-specific recombinase XerC
MRKWGKVQPELIKALDRDYERMHWFKRKRKKIPLDKREPIDPYYTLYKSLEELLNDINHNKITITWKDGSIEDYDPKEVFYYPEKNILNQSKEVKKLNESLQSAIKLIYHDSAGSRSIRTYRSFSRIMSELIGITKITDIKELENRQIFDKYIVEKQKPVIQSTGNVLKCQEGGIKRNLATLSAIISKFILNEIDFNGFSFTKNRAKLVNMQYHNTNNPDTYIDREKEEIEYWINSQTSIRNKTMWSLYAHGLRNHEIRIYEVKEKTSSSFKINRLYYNGLQINQIDFNKKCLTNVKRKGNKIQKFVCLDDRTITLLKNWINYRKQFHPEIENDPVLSKFVFSIKASTILSKLCNSHYKYLKRKLQSKINRLERKKTNKEPIPPALTKETAILTKIIKKGKITPHQLRHSWDILATRNNMRDYLRRHHLNHTLKGMDHVYVAPHITYEEYREEYDKNAPKFNIII